MIKLFKDKKEFNQDISGWNWDLTNKNPYRIITGTKAEEIYPSFDFTTGKPILEDPIYSNIDRDDDNGVSYLNAFIKDAKRHGLDLSYINTSYYNFELKDLTGYFGLAQTCGGGINITIDKNHWEKGQKDDKFYRLLKTIWHEFGHAILGLQHLCQYGQIMSVRSTNDCQMPPDETDKDKNYGNYLNDTYQWHRAVRDMMTGNKQVEKNCGSARGSKTFACHFE